MSDEWFPERVAYVDADWQQRFESALSSQGHAVWDWDMVSNEILWRGDCQAFGYSVEELSQDWMTWFKLMHPDDVAAMDAEVARVFDAKYPNRLEQREAWTATRQITYRVRQKDGSYLRVFDDAKCIFDENQRATYSTGIVALTPPQGIASPDADDSS